MKEQFIRTQALIGKDKMEKLYGSSVIIFGIGGVGGYVAEALARAGVGRLDLVDDDKISISNINRQIIATFDTVGEYKVDVMKKRILSINPECDVRTYRVFYLPSTKDMFDLSSYDYVVDAIDTVKGKLEIIENAYDLGIPVISSMGAGNKSDPSMFEVSDIYKTSVCPLAKVIRSECRKRGIKKLKVVYSKEKPVKPVEQITDGADDSDTRLPGVKKGRKDVPGSLSFVPSAAGLVIASQVVKDLIK